MDPVPDLVTMHLWTVPDRRVPIALLRMAGDRGLLGRTAGLRFAKLLGTGDGRTFTVRDADRNRWGLLATWVTFTVPMLLIFTGGHVRDRPGGPRLGPDRRRAAPGRPAAADEPGPVVRPGAVRDT